MIQQKDKTIINFIMKDHDNFKNIIQKSCVCFFFSYKNLAKNRKNHKIVISQFFINYNSKKNIKYIIYKNILKISQIKKHDFDNTILLNSLFEFIYLHFL